MRYEYVLNPDMKINCNGVGVMTPQDIADAMNYANQALDELNTITNSYEIDMFETLGMRNLSSTVGEYFAKSVSRFSNGNLEPNLHQDGYPDLVLTDTPTKKHYFTTLYTERNGRKYPIDKEHFSNYKFGGIEIKATCGNTPPANFDKNVLKPVIGEQRADLIVQIDWKSHHRQTNNLLGVVWDFIDGTPTFVGAFYCDTLTEDDWGNISKPKEKGGRTTSVSIMNTQGVKKMCKNWIAIIDDEKYLELFSKPKWIGYRVDNERLF